MPGRFGSGFGSASGFVMEPGSGPWCRFGFWSWFKIMSESGSGTAPRSRLGSRARIGSSSGYETRFGSGFGFGSGCVVPKVRILHLICSKQIKTKSQGTWFYFNSANSGAQPLPQPEHPCFNSSDIDTSKVELIGKQQFPLPPMITYFRVYTFSFVFKTIREAL